MRIEKSFLRQLVTGPLATAAVLLSACGSDSSSVVGTSSAGATDQSLASPTLTVVSGPTPFVPGCNGTTQTGTNYPNAEVEPWVAVDPLFPGHLIGVWQQDRWSNGGANGLLTGVSWDGGRSWFRTFAHFSRCAGGNPSNGGDYERASDPWVSFSPNGVVHQISLSFNDSDTTSAVLVSRSTSGGFFWSEPTTLLVDTDPNFFNDKESITADPKDSRLVYAVWDRLDFTDPLGKGPTWFARTTNGGRSWEPARIIYDPGLDAQTIGNQIVVLPDGTLVDLFALFTNQSTSSPGSFVAIIRSKDKGLTWSPQIIVSTLESIGVTDVKTGEPLRTGDILPSIAVDPKTGVLSVVWQDARSSGGARDGILYSRSTDGGLTWSAPAQVNQAPNVQAFTAAVAARNGTVAVNYYDLRNDNADPNVLLTNYWQITSRDGGRTWRETGLAGPFDMRTAPVARGFFVGDYEGLAAADGTFVPFFVATNSGNLNNRTDVFALPLGARVGPTTTSDVAAALSDAGAGGRQEINAQPLSLGARIRSHREHPRLSE